MPETLPFEYRTRQKDIPWENPELARRVLEQRDRELEDFLGKHLPAVAGDGVQRAAYIKLGLDWSILGGWEMGDGILDETYTGTWPVEYEVDIIGGESPVVEIIVPETAVYAVSTEWLMTLDGAATSDYQVELNLANNQSAFPDSFGRTHQNVPLITGRTFTEGSSAGYFSMDAGARFFFNAPTKYPNGSEDLASGVATLSVAWYCATVGEDA